MNFTLSKLLALAILVAIYLWTYKSSYIEFIDYKIYDIFSVKLIDSNFAKETITPSVVIVDIDQQSVDKFGQWPWPRIIDAQLIRKINEAKPSSIGLDIIFNKADKSSITSIEKFYKRYLGLEVKITGLKKDLFDNDQILASSLSDTKAILAVYLRENLNESEQCNFNSPNSVFIKDAKTSYEAGSMLCNVDKLHAVVPSFGFVNTQVDKDGIFRRTPLFIRYKETVIPAFSLANLLELDKDIKFLSPNKITLLGETFYTNSESQVLLQFYDKSWYKYISAKDILEGNVPDSELAGKIVLIGSSLIGQQDSHIVATRQVLNGVDIHATVIENILNEHLRWQPLVFKTVNTLLGFVLSVFMLVMIWRKAYKTIALISVAIFLISFLLCVIYFKQGIYLSVGYLWFPLVLYYIFLGFMMLYINDKEKREFFKELSRSHSAALDSMVMVAETKDFETGAHLIRTKKYIKLLANHLKNSGIYSDILTDDYIDIIYRASPLHDIGKVGIPDAILQKPGKLDSSEYKIMQNHPYLGMKIISNAIKAYNNNDFLTTAYNIAYYHHEKWNGNGYPQKLKGENIPLEARLMALVDVYDALISKRCYKDAYSFLKSEEIIIKERGEHFDPKIVDAFIDLKDEFREIAKEHK